MTRIERHFSLPDADLPNSVSFWWRFVVMFVLATGLPLAAGRPAQAQALETQVLETQALDAQVPPQQVPTQTAPRPTDPIQGNVLWQFADADCVYQITSHVREKVADADQDVETLRVDAGNGTYVRFVTAIEPIRIVSETEIVLPIKSDRRHLQVLARVVLPRTNDPQTGSPITILVRGQMYQDVNNWQRLTLTDIPRKRDEAARTLRLSLDTKVDVRESYIDVLALNVYGGRGTTTVRLSAPQVDGRLHPTHLPALDAIAKSRLDPANSVPTGSPTTAGSAMESRILTGPFSAEQASIQHVDYEQTLSRPNDSLVKTDGNLFLVKGRPTFIRMIQHQGEDFAFLRQLGFNTIRLSRSATEDDIEAAERNSMWVVCPPPSELEIRWGAAPYRRVVAWDIGDQLTTDDFVTTVERVNKLRSNENLPPIPVLGSVDTNLHAFSRHLDVLIHSRSPIGTSLSLSQYGKWLANRPRLARPGVVHWASIQTEPLPVLVRQWRAFQFPGVGSVPIEASQICHMAFAAVGAGVRGLNFQSMSPLHGPGTTAKTRAAALQLINAELDRIEPWAAGGNLIGFIDTDSPDSTAFVLHTKLGQLLCVQHSPDNQQHVPSPSKDKLSVTVPGTLAANEVFQLTDAGLKSLVAQRVAGGSRIEFAHSESPILVLMTQNPMVINSVSRRIVQQLPIVAQLRLQIAAEASGRTQTVATELAPSIQVPSVGLDLGRAERLVKQSQAALSGHKYSAAADLARQASNSTVAAQFALWQRSNRAFPTPVASPLCTQLGTLPWHWQLVRHLPASQGVSNLLPNGDFEQDQLDGWQSLEHAPEDVVVRVSLARGSNDSRAYTGRSCLRLSAVGASETVRQSVMESPLVWVNTQPVTAPDHHIVRVQGVVKVPRQIVGSADGVLIFDSMGGPELGYRITKTDDWQPFVFYRVASQHQPVSLTIALTGLGEVLVDDVTITPVVAVKSAAPSTMDTSLRAANEIAPR